VKKLLVTSCPNLDDVVQLEPTLEALYYAHAPCTLTLRTFKGYVPFFEHHPLISDVVEYVEGQVPEDFDTHIEIPNIRTWPVPVPTVDKFAVGAQVTLLRKTPKIFLEEWPVDQNIVIQALAQHSVSDWDFDLRKQPSKLNIVDLPQPSANEELQGYLSLLASALLVVGPDGWMTQAAAALDARVVMGMDPADEALRAPFNVSIATTDNESVFRCVDEVLYERRYPEFLNCGNAAEFVKAKAKLYMKSHFADVGCSAWPIPNGIPVDVGNRAVIEEAPDGFFSGVFSSHCLEHIPEWGIELNLWHRVIKEGGYMFLYLPHPRAEVWHAKTGSWVGSNHVWNPEPVTLVKYLKEALGMQIVEYVSRRDPLWSFHIVARKV
jgi:hypothetical protein